MSRYLDYESVAKLLKGLGEILRKYKLDPRDAQELESLVRETSLVIAKNSRDKAQRESDDTRRRAKTWLLYFSFTVMFSAGVWWLRGREVKIVVEPFSPDGEVYIPRWYGRERYLLRFFEDYDEFSPTWYTRKPEDGEEWFPVDFEYGYDSPL